MGCSDEGNPAGSQLKANRLAILCLVVLGIILTLGLWPFHSPRNQVTWLGSRDGLRFRNYGTAISSSSLRSLAWPYQGEVSIEIWLRPRLSNGSGTILTFYTPQTGAQFSLSQSLTDLEFRTQRGHATTAKLYVEGVFRKTASLFITVTSGVRGTSIYFDDTLVKRLPGFHIPGDLSGRMVLGDSAGQSHTWEGQIFGAAVYGRELPTAAVLRHYRTWGCQRRPQITEDDNNVARYLFDEHAGNVVHNRADTGANLFIPDRYVVLDQIFLEPMWKEFEMSWSYWGNAAKNIIGFIPLGFWFYAYLSGVPGVRRVGLFTIVLGSLVSLTIEVVQAYLPTRDSGTTDLITNTLGTWIGIISYRALTPTVRRFFSGLICFGYLSDTTVPKERRVP